MLLRDIQNLFDDEPTRSRITSSDLCQKLCSLEERPWNEWSKGKSITTAKIARYLKPYGVSPRSIRDGSKNAKGYHKEDFEDAFLRYIPMQSVTPSQPLSANGYSDFQSVTQAVNVTAQHPLKPLQSLDCDVVTDTEVF